MALGAGKWPGARCGRGGKASAARGVAPQAGEGLYGRRGASGGLRQRCVLDTPAGPALAKVNFFNEPVKG